jgi:hypothetical protein
MRTFRRRGGALLAAVPLAVAACLAGAGTAQAADLHYTCQQVIPLVGLPNHLVRGTGCTGPIATGWGTVTQISTGTRYFCDPIKGQVMLNEVWVFGQDCSLS